MPPHETHIISVDMSQANIIWIHPIFAHRNKFGNHLKNPSIKRTFLFLTFYDSRDIQEESQIIYLLWHCDGVLVGDTLTNGTMWCSVVCVVQCSMCVCVPIFNHEKAATRQIIYSQACICFAFLVSGDFVLHVDSPVHTPSRQTKNN